MTDPGQRILPGAGPLLPPMPLPPELPADDFPCCTHRCKTPEERFGCLKQVESPDLPIPAEAIEAMCDLSYLGKQITESHAKYLLAAALPHLRSLQVETQIEFGRALGWREAAEEIAAALEAVPGEVYAEEFFPPDGTSVDCQSARVMRFAYPAAKIARDIGKGDPNG